MIPLKTDFGDVSDEQDYLHSKLMLVHRAQSTTGNVITYKGADFFLNEIPEEFQIHLTTIDEPTADILLQTIKDVVNDNTQKDILRKCAKPFFLSATLQQHFYLLLLNINLVQLRSNLSAAVNVCMLS
jgi:hypothetical protein